MRFGNIDHIPIYSLWMKRHGTSPQHIRDEQLEGKRAYVWLVNWFSRARGRSLPRICDVRTRVSCLRMIAMKDEKNGNCCIVMYRLPLALAGSHARRL